MKLKISEGDVCINMHMHPPSSMCRPNMVSLGCMVIEKLTQLQKPGMNLAVSRP